MQFFIRSEKCLKLHKVEHECAKVIINLQTYNFTLRGNKTVSVVRTFKMNEPKSNTEIMFGLDT